MKYCIDYHLDYFLYIFLEYWNMNIINPYKEDILSKHNYGFPDHG